MADIRLTAGDDVYVQAEADKNVSNNIYGDNGNDSIRLYRGHAIGGRGDDRLERIVDPASPNVGLNAAYWDSPTGVEVNLAEGWALDGFGGRDTLIGITGINGGNGNDRIVGDGRDNAFYPNHGHDTFDGGAGNDFVSAWFVPEGGGSRVARLDELNIRVSADGRTAKITTKVGTGFSLMLTDVERIELMLPDGSRTTHLLTDFITPQVLAEDAIVAGDAMRWNAGQALGTATTLTYSFVTQSTQPGFRAFTQSEQQAVRGILAHTAQIAGLTFTELAESGDAVGQLRFGVSAQSASKGQTAYPGTQGDAAGDVWMDVESMASIAPGSEGYAALLHEIGHALGLRHPRNTDPGEDWALQLRAADDRTGLTAMSSQPSADGLFRADWGLLDVIALRYLYGKRDANVGNDTYALGAAEGAAAHTLVDDGGNDTIDASALASGVSLDLAPGRLGSAGITSAGFLGVENYGIAWDTWIEAAVGSAHDDVLVGNERANTLTGGLGNDWIDGGAGADVAVFAGARTDYLLSNSFGKLYVEARDGVGGFDTVAGIETLRFADQSIAIAAAALGADAVLGVDEDTTLTAPLPDPSDIARGQASYRLVTAPRHGSAAISADGQLSYTPEPGYSGSDDMAYELASGASSNRYQAYVTVRPVNDGPPVARDVTLLVPGGGHTAQGRLPLATDPDGDAITYAAAAGARRGDLLVASDGSYRYTPRSSSYDGTDSFTYVVGDGAGGTSTYQASLRIVLVNGLQNGTAQGDTLTGVGDAEGLLGLGGNDRLSGRGGNDVIDGGDGIDTAVYAGARSRYALATASFGWTVQDSGGEGNDSLANTERLKFSDRSFAIDLDGNAGIAARVIRAVFGAAALADKALVGIALYFVDAGVGEADLVHAAIGTPMFERLAGGRSNTALVQTLYRNVVGQAPGAAELQALVGLLDGGVSQAALAYAASTHALNAGSTELVGLAQTGIEFAPYGG